MTRRVSPLPLGDGPESTAARMMGVPAGRFREILPQLHRRGFPLPDPDTGLFDLDAVNLWRQSRHPSLYRNLLAFESGRGDVAAMQRPRFEALGG